MRGRMLAGIIPVLVLSGCVTQETIERERKIEEVKAGAHERLAAEAQAEQDRLAMAAALSDPEFQKWLKLPDTQAYLKTLCEMPPGPDRDAKYAEARQYHILGMSPCDLIGDRGVKRGAWLGPPAPAER